ncbi:unnamed protein product [Cyprideis torosa]|uniref:Uncharacterized protein n=1 Tax=Cyprideis torosa TaxID=163714 RepID=A0A7R8WAJ8_9CRUS|nr:unnamed protein product [Cyprideis torosa]CAG0891124.1 unnamed protein product [Cyprideis torosa]
MSTERFFLYEELSQKTFEQFIHCIYHAKTSGSKRGSAERASIFNLHFAGPAQLNFRSDSDPAPEPHFLPKTHTNRHIHRSPSWNSLCRGNDGLFLLKELLYADSSTPSGKPNLPSKNTTTNAPDTSTKIQPTEPTPHSLVLVFPSVHQYSVTRKPSTPEGKRPSAEHTEQRLVPPPQHRPLQYEDMAKQRPDLQPSLSPPRSPVFQGNRFPNSHQAQLRQPTRAKGSAIRLHQLLRYNHEICHMSPSLMVTVDVAADPSDPEAEIKRIPIPPRNRGNGNPIQKGTLLYHNIAGGTAVKEANLYPFTAVLGENRTDGRGMEWFCGATLITPSVLVTAAHCFPEEQRLDVVRLGEHNLVDTEDGAIHLDKTPAEIILHPDFALPSMENDIAIIKLSTPVTITKSTQPACLPFFSSAAVKANTSAIVLGWGHLEFGGRPADILQEVTVPIWEQAECRSAYANIKMFPDGIPDTVMCAGAEGKDSCQSDSGGPLLVKNRFRNYLQNNEIQESYVLAGVVSGGIQCGLERFPGIYTRIHSYLRWISAHAT